MATASAVAFFMSLRSRLSPLSQQPNYGRQDQAQDDHRRQRKIESKIFAIDDNVARQAAQRQLADPGPANTDQQNQDEDEKKEANEKSGR